MRVNLAHLLLTGALLSSGCAGNGSANAGTTSSGGAITCEWLEGPDNCWQKAVDQVYAECAVPEANQGYFGPDYLSCQYPNGDTDVYGSEGRALDGGGNGHDGFYVEATRNGSACFTFEAPSPPQNGDPIPLSLTTRAGNLTATSSFSKMEIKCADGRTFTATGMQMLNVLGCPMKNYPDGSSMVPLPGYFISESHLALLPPATTPAVGSLTRCGCETPTYDAGGPPPPEPACPSF